MNELTNGKSTWLTSENTHQGLYSTLTLTALFFCFKDFIYLFDRKRDSQREGEHKQGEWERKKQAPSRGA